MHLTSQKSAVGGYTASDFKAIKLVCLISDKKRGDSVGWKVDMEAVEHHH